MGSHFRLIWIDKAALGLVILVLGMFFILWLLLISAAGSAPTGRLTAICLEWATKAEWEVIIPAWIIVRLTYSLASRFGGVRWNRWMPVPALIKQHATV